MVKHKISAHMAMEDLLRLGQLFASLNWPSDDTKHSPFPFLFTRFCRMWARLARDERDLILAITPSYRWIRNSENEERFIRTWNKAVTTLPSGTQSIALVNLPKIGSKGPKSHDSMFYLAAGCESMLRLSGLHVSLHSSYSKYNGTHTTALAFLDDYVGTGDSVVKALARLQRRFPVAKWNAVIVLALAAQMQAASRLEALGCILIADTLLDRGIADNLLLDDKREAYRVMNNIGLRLGICQDERLGYGKSEGLITMTRTPNNTFPVYWTTKKVKGRVWNAPFPRFTERTSPDWGIENSWNFPSPAVTDSGPHSIELHQVLACVRDRRDPKFLEAYGIPFSRSLHYLKLLIEGGKVEFQGESLRLSPLGQRTLAEAPREPASRSRGDPAVTATPRVQTDRTAEEAGKPATGEQKSLYVPKEVVE